MPKATKTVRVHEIKGEEFCFEVESWTDPKHPHRVELLAHDGFSQCSCKSWDTRKWPAIRDHVTPMRGTEATECRHVKAARMFKWNQEMKRLAQKESQP